MFGTNKFTFRGGTHLREYKDTAVLQTVRLPDPKSVSIPLSQHIGAHAKPVVAKGDYVKIGRGDSDVRFTPVCPEPSGRS